MPPIKGNIAHDALPIRDSRIVPVESLPIHIEQDVAAKEGFDGFIHEVMPSGSVDLMRGFMVALSFLYLAH